MKIGDKVKIVFLQDGKRHPSTVESKITDIWENAKGGQDCYLQGFSDSFRINPPLDGQILFVEPDDELTTLNPDRKPGKGFSIPKPSVSK